MAKTTSKQRPSSKTTRGQSSYLQIHGRKNGPIRSVDNWFANAPPKAGKKHWKDGRSAKELATAWFSPAVPQELTAFFQAHAPTKAFRVDEALAEHVTVLDNLRGEHRNHDLLLVGRAGGKKTVVGIEAKADESFGDSLKDYVRKAKSRKTKTETKAPERLEMLTKGLFGRTIDKDSRLEALRFQLLSGAAGTLIEAKNKKASQAVFLIHVFESKPLKPAKLERNKAALSQFLRSFGGVRVPRAKSWLAGPIKVPGKDSIPSNIPLYVGVVTTDLSRRG